MTAPSLPENPQPAELKMIDDLPGHGLQPVVVAGHALLRPETARLAQRHLDGEQQVVAGHRAVVFLVHGAIMGQEH